MKLLAPVETKDLKQAEVNRELLRTQEMQKVADKTRKELANAEADFKQALVRQREEWIKHEEEHEERVQQMSHEIKVLEKRKEQALIPINIYKDQADLLMSTAQDVKNRAESHEKEVELLQELLEEKLDKVGQKEQDLTRLEKQLLVKQTGLVQQTDLVKEKTELLNQKMLEFAQYQAEQEQIINERKTALVLLDRSQEAREKKLKELDEALNKKAKVLEDQRKTLERAFKRLSP